MEEAGCKGAARRGAHEPQEAAKAGALERRAAKVSACIEAAFSSAAGELTVQDGRWVCEALQVEACHTAAVASFVGLPSMF